MGRNATVAVLLVAVIAGMSGLVAASVPLYRLFCAATGYNGTTQRASAAPSDIASAWVTVRFDAETAPDLAWDFRPEQAEVRVHPGQQTQVFFRAHSRSSEVTTGSATFNVTPTKTGIYFDKLQCFCFTKQVLKPGESKDMGVVFFVDPDLLTDPNTRDVRTITLSYTMFRAAEPEIPSAAAAPRASTPAVN
ncbi:MAG TPA: cytochrome c oxidase assembly protein, partial [Stellaceae bacterium]